MLGRYVNTGHRELAGVVPEALQCGYGGRLRRIGSGERRYERLAKLEYLSACRDLWPRSGRCRSCHSACASLKFVPFALFHCLMVASAPRTRSVMFSFSG